MDKTENGINDYKVFNFSGKTQFIQVDLDRFKNHKRNFYNTDWEAEDFSIQYQNDFSHKIKKPSCLGKLIYVAEKLSQNFPFLRTDFYIINSKIYFGELTFYHGAGYEKFTPESWNTTFGEMIKLPEK